MSSCYQALISNPNTKTANPHSTFKQCSVQQKVQGWVMMQVRTVEGQGQRSRVALFKHSSTTPAPRPTDGCRWCCKAFIGTTSTCYFLYLESFWIISHLYRFSVEIGWFKRHYTKKRKKVLQKHNMVKKWHGDTETEDRVKTWRDGSQRDVNGSQNVVDWEGKCSLSSWTREFLLVAGFSWLSSGCSKPLLDWLDSTSEEIGRASCRERV